VFWLFAGSVSFFSPVTPGGQYGYSTVALIWGMFFLWFSASLTVIQSCVALAYSAMVVGHMELDQFFLKADKDGDGILDEEDFEELTKHAPCVLRVLLTHLKEFGGCTSKFCMGYITFFMVKWCIWQTFLTQGQTDGLLCQYGFTAFTGTYPEEFSSGSQVFAHTPLSPFGFMVLFYLIMSILLVKHYAQLRDGLALSRPLREVLETHSDSLSPEQERALLHQHGGVMIEAWMVQAVEIPGYAVAAAFAFEEFFDALSILMETKFGCAEGNTCNEVETARGEFVADLIIASIVTIIFFAAKVLQLRIQKACCVGHSHQQPVTTANTAVVHSV